MRGWGMTNLLAPDYDYDAGRNLLMAYIESSNVDDPEQAIYWVAPEPYLGNKITSYGGKLTYAVTFTLPLGVDSSGLIKQDIRIEVSEWWCIIMSPGVILQRGFHQQKSELNSPTDRILVQFSSHKTLIVHVFNSVSR